MVIYNYADVLNVVHPVFAQESRSKLLLSDFVGICRSNVTITFVSDSNMPQSARQPTNPLGVMKAGKSDPVRVHLYSC